MRASAIARLNQKISASHGTIRCNWRFNVEKHIPQANNSHRQESPYFDRWSHPQRRYFDPLSPKKRANT